jgi:hypothetical protein
MSVFLGAIKKEYVVFKYKKPSPINNTIVFDVEELNVFNLLKKNDDNNNFIFIDKFNSKKEANKEAKRLFNDTNFVYLKSKK